MHNSQVQLLFPDLGKSGNEFWKNQVKKCASETLFICVTLLREAWSYLGLNISQVLWLCHLFCSDPVLSSKTLWPSASLTLFEVSRATHVWSFTWLFPGSRPRWCCDGFCPLSLDGIEQKIRRGLKDCSCALGTIETENCFQDFFIFPQRVISLCNSLPQEILPKSVTQRQPTKFKVAAWIPKQGLSLTWLMSLCIDCYVCHRMPQWCHYHDR